MPSADFHYGAKETQRIAVEVAAVPIVDDSVDAVVRDDVGDIGLRLMLKLAEDIVNNGAETKMKSRRKGVSPKIPTHRMTPTSKRSKGSTVKE